MDSVLLATKLRTPTQSHQIVRRADLVDALEHGILHHKLILVSAPAGYGKTTLLAQWANSSHFPIAWLSIGNEDNDLERFLRYLLAAWEKVRPGIEESPVGLLLGAKSPEIEAVLSAFINVANGIPDHTVFVLDDYHLIEDSSIHQALTFLLDHLPSTLHFVLAGRGEPPLPLARYRAHHELLEFQTEDLHFSVDETKDFLNSLMGLELTDAEIVPMHAQLEGWIAGLQLVALSLRRHRESVDTLVVTGRHRFIADYLSQDVLAHLPEDSQRFLLRTSILERLSGSLCDVVTEQVGGQAMLETLERENLFLVPLDDRREWFRYHRLFADFLQGELHRRRPAEVADLHRRATQWYRAHELPEPAFHHAVAAGDAELVVQIVERYLAAKLFGGEVRVVQRWLDSIPMTWYASHPELSLARAGILMFTGQFDACVRCIDEVEQSLVPVTDEDRRRGLAKVTAFRCFIACFQNDLVRAKSYADQALQTLPEEEHAYRADIYQALGDTYRGNGRWRDARACYLSVLDCSPGPAHHLRSVHVHGALADLDLRQGHLRDAAGNWRRALAIIQEPESRGNYPLPVIGWVYIRLGEILYEWNELPEAWERLSSGLARAELGGDVRAMIAGDLLASRLKLTEGDLDAATDYLDRTRPLVANASFPDWTGHFERCQLELWLAQDRLRAAVHWADAMLADHTLAKRPESERTHLAIARVLIVKGDMPAVEQATALLNQLLQLADAEGRLGITIEALALRSLAHWRRGDRADAMTSLEHALRLAEPEGYARLFADLGLPMARLLQEARFRAVMPDYVARLLLACGADLASAAPAEQALPEPLTHREQEILELLAAGLTNREIADKLVISPETVKKHTGTIYGKLAVGNRTEAAARARELDLLA